MRVAVMSYPMLFQTTGGLPMKIGRTVRALQSHGVDARLIDPVHDRLRDFDLVHVFAANNSNHRIVQMAKEFGKPVVVSTIMNPPFTRFEGRRARVLTSLIRRLSKWEVTTSFQQISDALEAADHLIALYRSHRPNDRPGDIAAVIAGDTSVLREASYTIAERKFRQGRAPVYLYSFNWRSPVRNGKLRAMHCMELPFVFDHPDLIGFMTGTGADRYELATNLSKAWVAFARSGNPNHSGIPHWNPWNPADWPTMVFNRETEAVNDPWGEERRALAEVRG